LSPSLLLPLFGHSALTTIVRRINLKLSPWVWVFALIISCSLCFGQTITPCEDALYLELKNKKLDDLSVREYKYFLNKDSICNKYLSNNNFTQLFSTINYNSELSRLESRKMLDIMGFTTIYCLSVGITFSRTVKMPSILIPAIGPILIQKQGSTSGYGLVLIIDAIIQSVFLFDLITTKIKIKNLEDKLYISVNPNPYSPTVSLSYKF